MLRDNGSGNIAGYMDSIGEDVYGADHFMIKAFSLAAKKNIRVWNSSRY
jgi:hypothetical protein